MWFPFATQIGGVWHLSTFFFECFFDILTFVVLFILIKKIKQPGSMLGIYLICYGIIRCVLEGFRDTAEALFIGNSGIRVSQLISGILIMIGVALLICVFVIKFKKKNKDA
jgi:prolipoprotein diacylglyceryltransferase